ncbi:hypothetical protein [Marinobacter sp. tcs-11]|uniref:hypothetical protein n=1 Tax=Marinobacter sp. tcs-11 TaxID=1742860 RepID=UPI00257EF1F6|nr:hypothetical protein [Marinobacter sp. tcs-11]
MSNTDRDTKPNVRPMDDDLRRYIENALPNAQYNPYKRWIIGPGNPATKTELLVLNIKLNDQEAIVACPERHLVATGSDLVETGIALAQALKIDLNRAPDTAVAATCNMPFDLDGRIIKPKSNYSAPQPEAAAHQPDEQQTPPAEASKEIVAEPSQPRATEHKETHDQGLFDLVDGELDSESDPNDEIQPSLF